MLKTLVQKARKLCAIVVRPGLWPSLLRGTAASTEHLASLGGRRFESIVDIGANIGQFSSIIQYLNPNAMIYAFEPLPGAVERYKRAVNMSRAVIHEVAISNAAADVVVNISDRSDSSSLLVQTNIQEEEFGTRLVETIEVKAYPLDHFGLTLSRPSLLKIDTQGTELDVLSGATQTLRQIDYIYTEGSFVELYGGQPLASELIAYAQNQGFTLVDIFNLARSSAGQALQADFLFRRQRAD